MSDEPKDTLRGQPFIEKIQKYTDPDDLAYGDQIERICDKCFYRAYSDNPDGNCHIEVDPTPHELFGFKKDEFLPKQIDGEEVGHYCKSFVNYTSE